MTVLAKNKEAYFNYAILEELEAGIVLSGHEVKSVKRGDVSLKGAHVIIKSSEAFLVNAHIAPYKYAGELPGYDPTRSRKLLLNKKEISGLIGRAKEQGMAVVPLELKTAHGLVKVKLGIGRGKKKYDKRETIKRREDERKIARAIRRN
ncbi:MAG: SsrA-binding protein SmpB [Candidatus Doudnabacteria bacterium]|nr:SsrA-binding protein SmpB [Candidatus Doudnabacteria bacterium]